MEIISRIRNSSAVRRFIIFVSIMGPGIITANVDNDAGGITTYSLAGADFRYAFIWSLIPIMMALVLVQEMSNRMGVVTGKGLSSLIREKFGIRITFYLILLILVTNFGNIVAEFAGIAASMEIFGVHKAISVPVCAILVWLLVLKGNSRSVEKIFLAACIFYSSYIISGFMVHPDWKSVATGFKPQLSFDKSYLMMFVGVVGTTIAPWMQFYQQASVSEKGITTREYKYSVLDTIVGCILVNVIAFFIIVVCGSELYRGAGIHPVQTADDAAKALMPLAGQYCSYLFAFGLLNASLFAASVLPLSTSYTVCESLGWETGLNRNFSDAPQFYSIYTLLIAIGACIIMLPGIPLIPIMLVSQVVNGLVLPVVLVCMLIIINDRKVMGEYANTKLLNFFSIAVVIGVSTLSLMLALSYFM